MKNNLSGKQFAAALHDMKACDEARKWVEGLDYNTAWKTCGNPGWMFFFIEKVIPLTLVVNELLVCRFAREVVYLTDDPRVLACIEVREAWVRGKATDGEREVAISGARDATMGAVGGATRAAGWNASRVAAQSAGGVTARNAAQSAAEAAAVIATAFVTELDEEWDTAYDAAAKTARARQCDIIRELVAQPELV